MSRKPRENLEGGIYHVYSRGNGKAPIFIDDLDRAEYLDRLGTVAASAGWRCLTYCLMANHVHLLIETPDANLSQGMQRLQGGYAQWFNVRHDKVGHLFQGRYGATRATSDEQLSATIAYIAMNPVKAGMCALPEDWPWSGHRAVLAQTGPPWLDWRRLLDLLGPQAVALRRYHDLVAAEGQTP